MVLVTGKTSGNLLTIFNIRHCAAVSFMKPGIATSLRLCIDWDKKSSGIHFPSIIE